MTEMAAANRRTGQATLAGIGLAAVLAAGIVGGVVGARVATTDAIQGAPNRVLAPGAQAIPKISATDPKWVRYGSSWESQYRAMYPLALAPKWAEYGTSWENRYRAMYPDTAEATWVEYGTDWENQYRAQHPDH